MAPGNRIITVTALFGRPRQNYDNLAASSHIGGLQKTPLNTAAARRCGLPDVCGAFWRVFRGHCGRAGSLDERQGHNRHDNCLLRNDALPAWARPARVAEWNASAIR
jgi:hypothetical protein